MGRTVFATFGFLASAVTAGAQSPGPYDTTYRVKSETALRASMSDSGQVIATIPAGTGGIVMRWCRPEIPFGRWQFGGSRVKRELLKARWCEVEARGKIGNVKGADLSPE